MLRLVFYFGLATPGNYEQRRNAKRVIERCERIHHVTKAGVLTHSHRFSPREKRSECDSNCLTFARRAHVIQRRITDHVVDQGGQKGTRHSGILRITKPTQVIDERESADHDFKTLDSLELRTLGLARDPRG